MPTMKNLEALYVHELRDLFSAEEQIIEALPKMAKNAEHEALKELLQEHLQETKEQRSRMEKIFKRLDKGQSGKVCKAMRGLIAEGEDVLEEATDPNVRDAAIIAAAQRVEHYEISGYGTAATYAERLGFSEDHELLTQTLAEEKEADQKLNKVAKEIVNPEAAEA